MGLAIGYIGGWSVRDIKEHFPTKRAPWPAKRAGWLEYLGEALIPAVSLGFLLGGLLTVIVFLVILLIPGHEGFLN